MATLTIKNMPDELYARLRARAAAHRRSIGREAIIAMEQTLPASVPTDPQALLAALRKARAGVRGVFLADRDLRAARRGGRA